jgi:broad-specificity NMP kinase
VRIGEKIVITFASWWKGEVVVVHHQSNFYPEIYCDLVYVVKADAGEIVDLLQSKGWVRPETNLPTPVPAPSAIPRSKF